MGGLGQRGTRAEYMQRRQEYSHGGCTHLDVFEVDLGPRDDDADQGGVVSSHTLHRPIETLSKVRWAVLDALHDGLVSVLHVTRARVLDRPGNVVRRDLTVLLKGRDELGPTPNVQNLVERGRIGKPRLFSRLEKLLGFGLRLGFVYLGCLGAISLDARHQQPLESET